MSFQWTSKNQAVNGVEDMVLLSKVTEDQIAENLKKRIQADLMYTYIGPALVAVNPYKKLPYFTEKEIEQYHGAAAFEQPPHVYALADRMFQNMITDEENQCVIISGESGAGKTESAKLIMNYIAAVSGRGGAEMSKLVDEIKKIIFLSNPLLESFGNAKTLRNNNSSRFGKYFEVIFSKAGAPSGGKISNFLLEKSRVVGVAKGERNFHVFYQITKGATADDRQNLGLMEPKYFKYLNSSNEYDADGIDDLEEYGEMKKAMDVCQISASNKTSIFNILAAILHLGNIEFIEDGTVAAIKDADALAFPAYLLGIPEEILKDKLLSRVMRTGGFGSRRGSNYNVPMNVQQAINNRDALSKALYSRMFDWIVQAVNNAMAQVASHLKTTHPLYLGVLDIFGFEIFEKNAFEQFCINYVNEKLQQIFIELTLKSEQEEYLKEGIQWTAIDYFNNKIVVELIESKKPPGIMAVLDDICFTMHAQNDGADEKFVQKLGMSCSQNKHFQGMQRQFVIHHYAGSVTYDCDGFADANKDTLFKDLIQLMQMSTNTFIVALFPEEIDESDKKRPTTMSFKIKNQSQELVDTLMRSVPSYVRCIKPNETKRPKDWDSKRVEHQVRYLNLKENIKVRRAGFCYRNFFDKFLKRYAVLTKETFPRWNGNVHEGIRHIMKSVDMDPKEWQLGTSKVFIKSPESLFLLEEQRDRKYHGYAKVIQRAYRRWKSRKYFLEMRKKAADIMYNKKERKRFSLSREFVGDYLNFLDNPILKTLVGKNERAAFADTVVKFDRNFKPTQRELIITDTAMFIIGVEKEKNGPNKGQLVKVVKRKILFKDIASVSLSTKSDDLFVLHIPSEFDNVFENVLKTEMMTVLSEKYLASVGRPLTINFSDSIQYSVKKTTWQSGGTCEIKFVADTAVKAPEYMNSGKVTTVRVAPGLPSSSRPNAAAQQPKLASVNPKAARQAYAPPAATQQAYVQPQRVVTPPSNNNSAPTFTPPMGRGTLSTNSLNANQVLSQSNPGLNAAAAAKKRPPPPPPAKKLPMVRALYDYDATEADELTLRAGDMITLISKDDPGWWTGTLNGAKGLFPSNYVEEV